MKFTNATSARMALVDRLAALGPFLLHLCLAYFALSHQLTALICCTSSHCGTQWTC